jgi:hypothetical protein
MRNFTANLVAATDASASSDWFYVGNMSKFTAIVDVTGDVAAAGTVTFDVSNETSTGGGSMMSFSPVIYEGLASPSVTIAGSATQITSVVNISNQWMRIVFARSAGSGGVLTVNVSGNDS